MKRIGGAAARVGLRAGLLAAAILLGFAAVALARDLLTVVQRETALRKDKKLLSPKVAAVREGDQVAKLEEDGSWYRVEFRGAEGWLPASAVSSDRKVVLSGQTAAGGVRATEQSAGARGFNPEVESRHRAARADLDRSYRHVDRIQERKFSEEAIARFIREGKLGEPLAQGRERG
ncbi:MAG: SH3 domain-containing protein, partial [Thermoanaerobaculia bacterium]